MRRQVTSLKFETSRRRFLIGASALGIALAGGMQPVLAQGAQVETMDVEATYTAAQAGEIFLVDIRRPEEWAETGVGEGAIALDMRDEHFVPTLVQLRQADPDKPIALICRTGNRSGYVTDALAAQGFPGLVNVHEGMAGSRNGPGWLRQKLPTYPGTDDEISIRLDETIEQ